MNARNKNRKLLQGIGIGYVVCLTTHIIAALLPVYAVLPVANRFIRGHVCCSHSRDLMGHILTDIVIFTSIIIPVALLTYIGHRVVRYFKCRCGDNHEENPCEECPNRK